MNSTIWKRTVFRQILLWIIVFAQAVALPSLAGASDAQPRHPDQWEPFGRREAPLFLALAVEAANPKHRWRALRSTAIGAVAAGTTVTCLKYVTNRRRPDGRRSRRANSSFPSGHAALAFASAGSLGELHRGLRPPLMILGALVARSRVRQRRHRTEEVAVGAAIGFYWGRWAARRELDSRDETHVSFNAVSFRF